MARVEISLIINGQTITNQFDIDVRDLGLYQEEWDYHFSDDDKKRKTIEYLLDNVLKIDVKILES